MPTLFKFILRDHLNSSSILTTDTGTIAEVTDYKPYGTTSYANTIQDLKDDYTFTGQEYDEESSLQYFGARYLDNEIGRFVSIDPLQSYIVNKYKLWDKAEKVLPEVLQDPQVLNSYAYAKNNPIIYTDPNGECVWDACIVEVSASTYIVTGGAAALSGLYMTYSEPINDYLVESFDQIVDKTSEVVGETVDTITNWWNKTKEFINKSTTEVSGSDSQNIEGVPNNFPENPNDFNPKNWKQDNYKNGDIKKWTSPDKKIQYEWNRGKPSESDHWHKNIKNPKGEWQRTSHPESGDTHIQPGESLY